MNVPANSAEEDFDETPFDIETPPPLTEDDERIDEESDRDYHHEFVGRDIKAFYHSGWHQGRVDYWNKELQELKVDYPDGTVDYIKISDIDDVEVMLL